MIGVEELKIVDLLLNHIQRVVLVEGIGILVVVMLPFIGELTDIIEIRYTNAKKFMLFKFNWVDNRMRKKEDEYKFTTVNFNHLSYPNNRATDEPFILASRAEQVWYVQDPMEPNWRVLVQMTLRDLFDMYPKDSSSNMRIVPQSRAIS